MWVRSFVAVTIGLVLWASASAQSHSNSGQRLIDGTATFDYALNPLTGSGNLPSGPPTGFGDVSMNFQLDGPSGAPAERQVVRGNWFYRVLSGIGDTRERYLVDASSKTTPGTDYVEWYFPDVYGADITGGTGATKVSGISAEMGFQLTSNGPNSATFTTWLCFQNNSSAMFEVETFFAIDFNLGGTAAGDDFLPLSSLVGGGRLIQAEDLSSSTGVLTTGVLFSGSTGTGSAMDSASNLFGQLNDNAPHSFFPDVNTPGGNFSGDGAALVQFHNVVDPGFSSPCVPVTFSVTRIPEPSGLSLAGVLLLCAGLRRSSFDLCCCFLPRGRFFITPLCSTNQIRGRCRSR